MCVISSLFLAECSFTEVPNRVPAGEVLAVIALQRTFGCSWGGWFQQGCRPQQDLLASLLSGALLHQPLPQGSHVVGPQAGVPLLDSLHCLHAPGRISCYWATPCGIVCTHDAAWCMQGVAQ